MPIYEYECDHGHRTERIRPEAERNDPIPCVRCYGAEKWPDVSDPRLMTRRGIELQKRARVIGGTLIHHRNEQHYTRGL